MIICSVQPLSTGECIECRALAHRAALPYLRDAKSRLPRPNFPEIDAMRRRLWTTIALLAFASAMLPSVPAHAGYGAIAWDTETGKAGWIWNRPTPREAAQQALRECGASGCRLVIKPTSACAALATIGNGKAIGAAARKTQDEARSAALTDCQKRGAGECVVRASGCNK
jgi:hypothetical protein